MKDKIRAALGHIEQERDCRILFAVESGSRAWGFASPDSDYDVRAVYVKPLDWYLQLDEPSADTISAMLPDDLDVVAWDIRKFLRHVHKSNPAVLEWLGSPIVYCGVETIAEINAFKQDCVEPARLAFHYASMFRHVMETRTADGTIGIKKLCYALRASLCVRWAVEKGTMPPTAFAEVRAGLKLTPPESQAIDRLLARKAEADEAERLVPPPELADLLRDRFEELQTIKWPRRPFTDVAGRLTDVFRRIAKGS